MVLPTYENQFYPSVENVKEIPALLQFGIFFCTSESWLP